MSECCPKTDQKAGLDGYFIAPGLHHNISIIGWNAILVSVCGSSTSVSNVNVSEVRNRVNSLSCHFLLNFKINSRKAWPS
jgi:hypothetical protein